MESKCGDLVESSLTDVKEDVAELYSNYLTVNSAVIKLFEAKDDMKDDITLIKTKVGPQTVKTQGWWSPFFLHPCQFIS